MGWKNRSLVYFDEPLSHLLSYPKNCLKKRITQVIDLTEEAVQSLMKFLDFRVVGGGG